MILIKKIYSIFAIAMFAANAVSQSYTPFNFEKGIWNCSSYIKEDGDYHSQYYCQGDTMINDLIFYKLYEYSIHHPMYGFPNTYRRYLGLIGNNTSRQVILNGEILYDFNLYIGDTIKTEWYRDYNLSIKAIDSVQYCNTYHKRYIIDTLNIIGVRAFIEGIGFTLGLIDPVVMPHEMSSNLDCYGEKENEYCSDCNLLLDIESTLNNSILYPNPAVNEIIINSPNKISSNIEIYVVSLSGQTLISDKSSQYPCRVYLSSLSNGIYCVIVRDENSIMKRKIVVLRN
jgi:hypothetical protein